METAYAYDVKVAAPGKNRNDFKKHLDATYSNLTEKRLQKR